MVHELIFRRKRSTGTAGIFFYLFFFNPRASRVFERLGRDFIGLLPDLSFFTTPTTLSEALVNINMWKLIPYLT